VPAVFPTPQHSQRPAIPGPHPRFFIAFSGRLGLLWQPDSGTAPALPVIFALLAMADYFLGDTLSRPGMRKSFLLVEDENLIILPGEDCVKCLIITPRIAAKRRFMPHDLGSQTRE